MKKAFILTVAVMFSFTARAQWNSSGSDIYNNNAGKVGIGTASPIEKLDVQGGNAGIYNTGNSTSLTVGSSVFGCTNISLNTSANTGGYGVLQSVNYCGISYGNTIVNPNGGNVAIGTTDPQGYKLAVNGDMIATSVKVKLYADWPDYVFKPQYHLPTLSSVKTYIDQNSHLPDLPSEQEVIKDGLNLGEMNKLLVKKVEELTLYLIDQQKQIDELKKLINSK